VRPLGYQPRLDGLRAIAVALVIGLHVFQRPAGGYMGVDLFFVLSGFLITTLLLEEHAFHGRVSLRRFYARRALRLVPALLVFLVVSGTVYALQGRPPWAGVALGLTYLTNVGIIVGHWDASYEHLWSLAVEEQFYLAWPLLLLLGLRWRNRFWRLALIALAGAIAIATARYLLMPAHVSVRFGWPMVTRFDSILLGCAAALVRRSGWKIRTRSVAIFAFLVGAGIVAAGAAQTTIYDGYTFAFSIAAAFLVLAAADSRSRILSPLAAPPLVYVGKLSYALYLWHPVVLSWLTSAQPIEVILFTFLLAAASYHLVERPFLSWKWRLAQTPTHDRPAPAPKPLPPLRAPDAQTADLYASGQQ
jgi:peptidoglycan/LPS O-acetylase OafA/YrhL